MVRLRYMIFSKKIELLFTYLETKGEEVHNVVTLEKYSITY